MGLRDKLNQNPALAAGLTGGVLLIAVVMIFWSVGGGGGGADSASTKDFYTIDDGASTFVDEVFPQRIAPFPKDGKTAYRAIVWSCDGGNTKIVSGLQRFNEAAKKRLQALADAKNFSDPLFATVMDTWTGTEMKAPKTGDGGTWIKTEDPRASSLLVPTCPGGGTLTAVEAR